MAMPPKVKISSPTPDIIKQAGAILAESGLVVIPTDTVYGLAANALDKYAVARIFETKGRPATKPLIVLIGDHQMAQKLAEFSPLALDMAKHFWPGGLTLILKKKNSSLLPEIVTAGGETLALRIPKDPVALAVIKSAGLPLAVTSANSSGDQAPKTAVEVSESIPDGLDMILDGGPSTLGIESTVLDLSGERPVIKRKGAVSQQALEKFLNDRKKDVG